MSSTFENFPSSHQTTIVGADEYIKEVDIGFHKLWIGHILETIEKVGNAKMKALIRHKSMEQQELPLGVPVEAERRAA
jgi:hypothetical protein